MSYADNLKDPRWQRRRLDILERDDFTCQFCGDKTKTLHVHHIKYFPGMLPWEYSESLLITLCADCHEDEESKKKDKDGNPASSLPQLWTWQILSKVWETVFFWGTPEDRLQIYRRIISAIDAILKEEEVKHGKKSAK